MHRQLSPVPVGPTDPASAATLTRALRAALDGSGPAVVPVGPAPAEDPGRGLGPGRRPDRDRPATVPEPVALVVTTSGSTGVPRGVLLDTAALLASAAATHERLAGPGRWVLALPLAHIAGVQVLLRSVAAGTTPLVLPADGGFEPEKLAALVAAAPGGAGTDRGDDGPLYTSLVPTQLHRIVAASDGAGLPPGLTPLRRFDAILLGGSAAPTGLLDRARELGLRVVTTYGMTETCGGCVYDGVPLAGVRVAVADDGVSLAGPVLARGYLDEDEDDAFRTDADGTRWFRTRDLGVLSGDTLRILGRADDVIVTGGHKVAPGAVEEVLARLPGVGQVCVVGVPDPEWGQAVTAVVVPAAGSVGSRTGGAPSLERLRTAVSRTLSRAAAPRHLVVVDHLPERGPGKVDRAEAGRRAAAALGRGA